MATIVFVHAHPDDEATTTAGSMARAAAEGHRAVLVVCTDGALGEVPEDLAPGETLVDRRRLELAASTAVLGVARTVWLGYGDSGMTGWPQNDDPASFWRADVEEAAGRLAAILGEEHADVVVVYDWHGGYGHPDHVQVHRVGHRAAELAGTPKCFEVSYNRDVITRMIADLPERTEDFDPDTSSDDGNPLGTAEADLHLAVDVSAYTAQKRQALLAHASQVTDISMFLTMPDPVFEQYFGTEWYIEPGAPPGLRTGWLLGGRLMAIIRLVRHGRATAGWDMDPDPGLDDVGVAQADRLADRLAPLGAVAALPIITSPLRRCQETAAPLAARWSVTPVVDVTVAEIPSPPGVPMGQRVAWLREAMVGTWSALGPRYTSYRNGVAERIAGLTVDTVVTSHFVAINAVIGACLGDDRMVIRSLDNTSVTIVEATASGLVLIESGHEADTLIR